MARKAYESSYLICYGISMGDEGKGRVICELARELHREGRPVKGVLKVNGGANSGHTAAGLKLNLLPSGVTEEYISHLLLGTGVVADPRKILWEALPLETKGYRVLGRLVIDERTQVSDITHRLLDLACEYYRENTLGEEPRGSTGRGITPAYMDEVGQWQIYFQAFKGTKEEFSRNLKRRVDRALRMIQHVYQVPEDIWVSFFDKLTEAELRANELSVKEGVFQESEFGFRSFMGEKPFTLNEDLLVDTYWEAGFRLVPNISSVTEIVRGAKTEKTPILAEFGQSFWLDKRHGYSPNVTASHTYPPEFFISARVPVQKVHTVGCCKAYDTKVGTHLFLTRMPDAHPLALKLSQLEYGTTTGRYRMVGWFDAVEKGNALKYGGFDDLIINKLDVLAYSGAWQGGELLVCTAYQDQEGNLYYTMPRDERLRKTLRPVYRQYAGWSESVAGIKSFDSLPMAAKQYVAGMMKAVVDVAYQGEEMGELFNVRYIGVGPEPGQIIDDVPHLQKLLEMA